MMIRVYIAGSYSGDTTVKVMSNIGRAVGVFNQLLTLGFAPYCPHFDFISPIVGYKNIDVLPLDLFYKNSLEWMKQCDAVLVLPFSEKSKGVQREVETAQDEGIPVFYSIETLSHYFQR